MSELIVKSVQCTKLNIKDNHTWVNDDGDSVEPADVVTHTKITVTYNNIDYIIYDGGTYKSSQDVLITDIDQDVLLDGFYTIEVKYTTVFEYGIVTITEEFFNKCNLECKVDQLVASTAQESECDDCNKDKLSKLQDITFKLELLCYSIECSERQDVLDLYDYLNNLLIDYNCRNC